MLLNRPPSPQMIQFYLCLLHAVLVAWREHVLPAHLAYLQLAYHVCMLALFSDFQRRTYGADKQARAAADKRSQ